MRQSVPSNRRLAEASRRRGAGAASRPSSAVARRAGAARAPRLRARGSAASARAGAGWAPPRHRRCQRPRSPRPRLPQAAMVAPRPRPPRGRRPPRRRPAHPSRYCAGRPPSTAAACRCTPDRRSCGTGRRLSARCTRCRRGRACNPGCPRVAIDVEPHRRAVALLADRFVLAEVGARGGVADREIAAVAEAHADRAVSRGAYSAGRARLAILRPRRRGSGSPRQMHPRVRRGRFRREPATPGLPAAPPR